MKQKINNAFHAVAAMIPHTKANTRALFFNSCEGGDFEDMKEVLRQYPEALHWRNEDGMTALHWAASRNRPDVVDYLLMCGADIEAHSDNDYTPLHLVSCTPYDEMLELLVERDANVNTASKSGSTPLHSVVNNGSTKGIQLLLAHGAQIDSQDKHGLTPLMWAVTANHLEAAKTLLAAGADFRLRSETGETAQDIARNNGIRSVEMLLQAAKTESKKAALKKAMAVFTDGLPQDLRTKPSPFKLKKRKALS